MLMIVLVFLMIVVMTAMLIMLMIVLLMIVVMAAVLIVIMMVVLMLLMVMVVAAAGAVFIMLMVVMRMLLLQLGKLCSQSCLAFHGVQQLLTGQRAPGSGNNGGSGVMLPQQGHSSIQLGLGNGIGAGQDDGGGSLDLVVVEFAEVLHIDLDLTCVGNGNGIAQGNFLIGHLVHRADNIGQLADAGGLDEDAVRSILLDDLGQGLAEIAHQRAADAAGVHFGDVDAGILQEAAVNADLAEFVLNEDQLLALVGFGDHLLDEGRLAGTEEAGINIDFCHSKHLL